METQNKPIINIETTVNVPVQKVWEYWNLPEHITKWGAASNDWHTTKAENNLTVGGTFVCRMEAKDKSFGFDFGGVYDAITEHKYIEYTIGDGRKVKINFSGDENKTHISESFEAEGTNPVEMQQAGWQAILDNFKKYTEAN